MDDFDISIKNLSKIEGHANLDVKVRNGKVEDVKLQITENQRFYEQAVRGQPYMTAPQLMSRICGTCSVAHLTCCIEAIENALEIKPTEQSVIMKKLSTYGLMIRDHALHLYFFGMPDVFGRDSILDFASGSEKEKQLLQDSFSIKRAGNMLSTLVAGKAIHAPYPTVGGFLRVPDEEGIRKNIEELKKVRPLVLNLIGIYYNWQERMDRDTDYVALCTQDFSYLQGQVKSSRGICIQEKDYLEHLIKILVPYSQAYAFEFEGEEFMVGALARLNLNKDSLHENTKRDAEEFLRAFPSKNIFHNNLAQAIEILHSIDHSIELLGSTKFKKEEVQKAAVTEDRTGIGVIEAPRGTLYYKLTINKEGKISNANVIVPSAQNQINMERDIAKLVQENISKPREHIEFEIEKLVRAYDPCMSCASHFLKVNWA